MIYYHKQYWKCLPVFWTLHPTQPHLSGSPSEKKPGVKPSTSGCKTPVKSSDDSVPKESSGETASEVPVKSSRKRPRTRTATVTKTLKKSLVQRRRKVQCNKVYVDGEKWVVCDICDQWFDGACTWLTDEQWQNLDDNDCYSPECLDPYQEWPMTTYSVEKLCAFCKYTVFNVDTLYMYIKL